MYSLNLLSILHRQKRNQKNIWQRLNEAMNGLQDSSNKSSAQSDRILISEVSRLSVSEQVKL